MKIQYPQLRVQTKIDLFVLKLLINMSNKIARYYDDQTMDFRRFNDHFRMSLVKELDFANELVNCERTRNHFRGYDDLYMPKTYLFKSSRRTLVMEFVRGMKIDDIEGINAKFGPKGARRSTDILVDVFGRMIFNHGMVHCDAHPGNIMVRENPEKAGQP